MSSNSHNYRKSNSVKEGSGNNDDFGYPIDDETNNNNLDSDYIYTFEDSYLIDANLGNIG